MRLQPDVVALDGRALFRAVTLREGGHAIICRECGAFVRLEGGHVDARAVRHVEGCSVGRLLGEAGKPIWLRAAALEIQH